MDFKDKLKALKSLAKVQAALGGVFISNKVNHELSFSYCSLDNMLIQLRPYLAAEKSTITQYRIQSNTEYDESGRVVKPAKELMVTSFIDLDSGESIDDVREINVAPVNNIITSQIMVESETHARKSALRCLFAAHDSEYVPQSDARELMSESPATDSHNKSAQVQEDEKNAREEAKIAASINQLVHNPDHEVFFNNFLKSKKLTGELEKFAIQYYAQAIKTPKGIKGKLPAQAAIN